MRLDDDDLSKLVEDVRKRRTDGAKISEAIDSAIRQRFLRPLDAKEMEAARALITDALDSDFHEYLKKFAAHGKKGPWVTGGRIHGLERPERIGFSSRDRAAMAEVELRHDEMHEDDTRNKGAA